QSLSCGPFPATTGAFTLKAGDKLVLHVVSQTGSASCGTYNNTASFTSTNQSGGSKSTSTTVNCPNVIISKTADNASVNAGQQIGFKVTLDNSTGAGDATGLVLTDNLPGGPGINWSIDPATNGITSIPSNIACAVNATPPQALTCGPSPATSGAFTLKAGDKLVLHVVSQTGSTSCGTYNNTASFTSGNQSGGSKSTSTTVNCPNVIISKTADNASVNAGQQIGFKVTLDNSTGSGDATGLVLTDNLPGGPGINWSIDPATNGITSIPSNIACAVNATPPQALTCGPSPATSGAFTLKAGDKLVLHVVSQTGSTSCGTYNNTASFTSGNDGTGSKTASTTVNCPTLTFSKTADNASVNAGQQIGFKVTLDNSTGSGDATGLVLTDNLPGGPGINWSIDPATNGITSIPSNIACAVNATPPQALTCGPSPATSGAFTLKAGDKLVLHVVSGTSTATCGATITNTASFTSSNGGTGSSASVTITVNCAVLHVSKSACPTAVVPGGLLTYTITYSNSGAAPATNAVLVDTIPAGTQVSSAGGGT